MEANEVISQGIILLVKDTYFYCMWTCSQCRKNFVKNNQSHSCNDKSLADHLKGKSVTTIELYDQLVRQLSAMADIQVRPTKSAIAFATDVRFGYIHRLGKDYVDLVLCFNRAYEDNLCFHKIANVPGSDQHNHYFRMRSAEDLNDEILMYIGKAIEASKR
jgi:hypothetical protein